MRRLILLMVSIGAAVVLVSAVAVAADVDCSTNPCFGTSSDPSIERGL